MIIRLLVQFFFSSLLLSCRCCFARFVFVSRICRRIELDWLGMAWHGMARCYQLASRLSKALSKQSFFFLPFFYFIFCWLFVIFFFCLRVLCESVGFRSIFSWQLRVDMYAANERMGIGIGMNVRVYGFSRISDIAWNMIFIWINITLVRMFCSLKMTLVDMDEFRRRFNELYGHSFASSLLFFSLYIFYIFAIMSSILYVYLYIYICGKAARMSSPFANKTSGKSIRFVRLDWIVDGKQRKTKQNKNKQPNNWTSVL